MTLEALIRKIGGQIGEQIGNTRTINPGKFGEENERIRVAIFPRGIIWEQNGHALYISGMSAE